MRLDETPETQNLTQRQLMLKMFYLQVEINGSVKQLKQDMYGDQSVGVRSVKGCVAEHDRWIDRVRTILYALAAVVVSLGVVEVVRLIQWLAG